MSGYVSNVVFPSGALLQGDTLSIYYGAADTTGCLARVSLRDLVASMLPETSDQARFKRCEKNPIITSKKENSFESKATFNPAAIELGGKVNILYRAMSDDNTSTVGLAVSANGTDIAERLNEPVYVPRGDFEMKKVSGGNSGCEDPRLTKIGKDIFMCYTAFDGIGPPRVAVSSIPEKDFLARKWDWKEPFLLTPGGFDDKDACLLPTKFKDGYFVLHRVDNEICGDYLKTLDFHTESVKKCIRIMGPRRNAWDSAKVGITAPPIRTKYGWLLIYHGVSKSRSTYRIGAALLDLKDPAIVIARGADAIFEPEQDYEKNGIVANVVFPCGMVERKGLLYIYYGGADKVVGVATMKLQDIIKPLLRGAKY
jgi:predicted GH43/DUF377 family glycosyl hydrolase